MYTKEKLYLELDAIFKGDKDRHINAEDLKEMKYLECCIKESLRLFPSVPMLGRIVKQPFKLDEDTTIPPGITIFLIPYKIHRNSKYFPKPEEYIPERFAAGSLNRNPFAYIPFSGGPRNCIGQKYAMMEAKILLATILRKYKVESQLKSEELELLSEIVLRSQEGLQVKFHER